MAHFGLVADGKFGTEKLWTVLPNDGIWRGPIPSKLGDFAYSDKLPWFRVHPAFSLNDGPLTITGKRLDGPAPSFTETYLGGGGFPDDDENAMIMGGIEIPVFRAVQHPRVCRRHLHRPRRSVESTLMVRYRRGPSSIA